MAINDSVISEIVRPCSPLHKLPLKVSLLVLVIGNRLHNLIISQHIDSSDAGGACAAVPLRPASSSVFVVRTTNKDKTGPCVSCRTFESRGRAQWELTLINNKRYCTAQTESGVIFRR